MAEPVDALVIGGGTRGADGRRRDGACGAVGGDRGGQAVRGAEKFLMAGKSGLNLTKDEPFERFAAAYGAAAAWLSPMLQEMGPAESMAWAEALGQPVFTGSSGVCSPWR